MSLITKRPKTRAKSGGLLSTRQGTISVALAVAMIAGALVLLFIDNYRSSVAAEGEPAKVLIANGLIEKGSTGDVLSTERMFRTATVRADQVKAGAVTDPALLRSKVAAQDILPGQQLLGTDFVPARDAVSSRLQGGHRAIAVPVDKAHGLVGPLRSGDRVDVYGSFPTNQGGVAKPVLKKLANDVLVLKAAPADGSDKEGAVLRVPARVAAQVAFTADNGKVWVALRPGVGVREAPSEIVTLESILFGKTINVEKPAGGR